MDRLIIISKSELIGSSFGSMVLSLSSPQFKIVTKLQDLDDLRMPCIYVHDDQHPDDSVEITSKLNLMGAYSLKDKNYLLKFIGEIWNDVNQVTDLFLPYRTASSTQQGIDQIEAKMQFRGLTKDKGFEYFVSRTADGIFSLIPRSDLMQVIVNLCKGYYYGVIRPQMEVPKIPVIKGTNL